MNTFTGVFIGVMIFAQALMTVLVVYLVRHNHEIASLEREMRKTERWYRIFTIVLICLTVLWLISGYGWDPTPATLTVAAIYACVWHLRRYCQRHLDHDRSH